MKWENRGHEFDNVYMEIARKREFYLFGAGDYGTQFVNAYGKEFHILGYIDNSPSKRENVINGFPCISLEEVELSENVGVVVTMSQIARVNPLEQLKKYGLVKDKDYFVVEEFISVYYAYKYNKVHFSTISFLPSTACNLNCKLCLNFNPYAKKFYVRDWKDLKKDVDLFFSCVDYIMLFHVSGGEPLIYRYTADLIKYIDTNYGDRIGTLRTVTNGTVVPEDEVFEKLSKCKVEITVDDYRKAVPEYFDRFDSLIEKLNHYNIKYYINTVDDWIDLAPDKTDYSTQSEEWLQSHRDECSQSWQELRGGKLYSCNYAAYATVAGLSGDSDEEVYELKDFDETKTKELIEFRLGFTTKGYTEFCKKCRGFTPKNCVICPVAEQTNSHDQFGNN